MLRPTRRPRGFTLVELMVLIGIVGLLAAIAVPSFRSYNRANRLGTTADMMIADLSLARATAVAQGRVFRLDATETGYTVVDAATGDVMRDRTFEGSVRLPAAATVHFFPWGAAETAILTLDDGHDQKQVRVLPTGIMEVGP
jgi:type II secretion system protein H